ncbi:MAG: hypothetical protein WAW36_17220 [Methylovulum miyakonense]
MAIVIAWSPEVVENLDSIVAYGLVAECVELPILKNLHTTRNS